MAVGGEETAKALTGSESANTSKMFYSDNCSSWLNHINTDLPSYPLKLLLDITQSSWNGP